MSVERMTVKSVQVLNHHTDHVFSVQFAKGSDLYFASASKDNTVRIFEWKNGAGFVETQCSPIFGHVRNAYWSPQGAFLLTTSGDNKVILWNSQTGDIVNNFIHPKGSTVSVCAFSTLPTAIIATAAEDGTVCFWDSVTFNKMRFWSAHEDSVSCCHFTADSNYFLTSSKTEIKVWHVKKCVDYLVQAVELLKYKFDCADYEGVTTFDVFTIKRVSQEDCVPGGSRNEACQQPVDEVQYSIAVGGESNIVSLWYLSIKEIPAKFEPIIHLASRLLRRLVGHNSTVTQVVFNHSGSLLASVSLDKTLRLWEMSNFTCRAVVVVHDHFVTACSFSKNDIFLATASYDREVKIWDLTGGSINLDTCLSGDSEEIMERKEELLKCKGAIYKSIKVFQKLSPSGNSVNSVHFGRCNKLAVGGSDKLVTVWKLGEKFEQSDHSPLTYHKFAVQQVEFSRCGKWLLTCSYDGRCVLWDTITWEVESKFFFHNASSVTAARFSPDSNMLATGSTDETAKLWNLSAPHCMIKITNHADTVSCLAFARDSRLLATGSSSGDIKLWSCSLVSTNLMEMISDAHDLGVTSCDFSNCVESCGVPLYTLATCGRNDRIKVFEISPKRHRSGAEITVKLELLGHGGFCTCVRFAPCDLILASTSSDKTCRLWSMQTGLCLYVLNDHLSILTCCAFSEDCEFLATGSLDRTVIIYKIPELSQSKEFSVDHEDSFLTAHNHRKHKPALLNTIRIGPRLDNTPWALDGNVSIPDFMLCPINCTLMSDPVRCTDGFTYERSAIETWFHQHRNKVVRSPMTNLPLVSLALVSDTDLKSQIEKFKADTEATAASVCEATASGVSDNGFDDFDQ